MKMTNVLAAVAAILALGAISTVHAQKWDGPRHHGMTSKAATHGDWKGRKGHHGKSMCGKARYIDGRLAFLKTELKITSEQEQLWGAYESVVRDNAKALQERCDAKKAEWKEKKENRKSGETTQRAPLPERLDSREQSLQTRLEALRARNNALKPLYEALNDEQKQTADELIRG
jgi:hypothetical protein